MLDLLEHRELWGVSAVNNYYSADTSRPVLCGVKIEAFSIGFGKKIWERRLGETRYSIGIVPLGGYVRMVGDDPRGAGSAAPAIDRGAMAAASMNAVTAMGNAVPSFIS